MIDLNFILNMIRLRSIYHPSMHIYVQYKGNSTHDITLLFLLKVFDFYLFLVSESWNSIFKHLVPNLDQYLVVRFHLRPLLVEFSHLVIEDALAEAHAGSDEAIS